MLAHAPRLQWRRERDGYRTAARVWPLAKPSARLVVLHGIISHGGWYLRSGEAWAAQGLEVHLLDRRGSGLNRRDRGDVDRFETWCLDVEDYLESFDDSAPIVLMGISLGGALAAAVARRRPELAPRLLLACPGLFSSHAANAIQQRLLRLAASTRLRQRQIDIPLKDPRLFTDNADWLLYVAQDPLTLRRMTLRFAWESAQMNQFAVERPDLLHSDTLLLLAERDRIVDNQRTRAFIERIAGEHETIEFPGAEHTLEFAADPQSFFNAVSEWTRRTVSSEMSLDRIG